MNPPPFLSVRGLGVLYRNGRQRVAALRDVDFDLAPGRRLALVGESGSGKSTLAMAIAGLLPESASITGSVSFPSLGAVPRPGRDLGVVFQDPGGSLNPVLSVGDQIAEIVMVHHGVSWRAARIVAAELLDRVRIPRARARLQSFPHEFSGGQRQRIAMAAALAGEPRLLIADEPTSALDTVAQRELVLLLDELVREKGLTLLFVTHDIALASGLADEVAVLLGGTMVEHGSIGSVFAEPTHAYTRALLATRLDLDTPISERLLEIDAQTFAVHRPGDMSHG
jgi:peptide/nickel transport system ATP-binding protein